MPEPTRRRVPADTLFAAALRAVQRHPVKSLQAWNPRLATLDSGRLRSRCSGTELRSHILRALALGRGWHDGTAPPELLAAAEAICLANSTKLTIDGVARVAELAGPGLEALDLTNQFVITDALVARVAQSCPALRVLSLVGCRKVTGASVDSLLRLPHLASVDLGGCLNIATDAVLRLLVEHPNASRFTGLGIAGLAEPRILEAVTKRTGALTWLSLGYSLATSSALLAAATANPHLAALLVHWCDHADDEVLGGVAAACPALFHIDVTGCKGVTNAGIIAFAGARAECGAGSSAAGAALPVDVSSPAARKWDLDETEWLDFALRSARAAAADLLVGEGDKEETAGPRRFLRIIAAKHSGVTRAVAEPLNRMSAVLQLLV